MVNRNGSNNGVHKDTAIAARNGNGAHNDPAIIDGHELLWDGLPPAVTNALGQPIDPALVSQRKGRGGRVFDYLEGHAVIDQANRIFGYGGWGYELVGDVTLRQIETVDHPDRRDQDGLRLQRAGASHRCRRSAPHRHRRSPGG